MKPETRLTSQQRQQLVEQAIDGLLAQQKLYGKKNLTPGENNIRSWNKNETDTAIMRRLTTMLKQHTDRAWRVEEKLHQITTEATWRLPLHVSDGEERDTARALLDQTTDLLVALTQCAAWAGTIADTLRDTLTTQK